MKEELFEQIKKNSPNLFEGAPGFPLAYIECDDGWFDIIDAALSTIQGHITNRNNQILNNIEWHAKRDIGEPIPDWRRETELLEYPQVQQIKEKFGGLRVYTDGNDETIHALIGLAESMANRTCEGCGKKGKNRSWGGWYMTYCDTCAEEYRKKSGKQEDKDDEEG